MATQNTIEQQLQDTLATQNFETEMLGADGKPTNQVQDAKTFTFDYVSGSGKNYGTMVIVLDTDNDMKIMYGDNLGRTMEPQDKDEFFDFLEHMGLLARRNRWTRTTQDINQLKYTMQGLAAIKEGLFEGYYGNRVVSYSGQPTEARLMIKHSQQLGEDDARYRHVESIFIETTDGERFKLESRSLSAARAMLEHVRQGGKPYDIRGSHITEMIREVAVLSRFNRASSRRVMEGVTQQIVEQAQHYYKQLRENIKHLATPRGYKSYFETWHPATITEQDELVEGIKNLFIEQRIDSRIEEALPLLARLQKQGQDMKEIKMFESWVETLGEGTWALPDDPAAQKKLNDLMAKELIVGPDATNATEQLYDVVGDDELFDILQDLAQRSNGRANVWDDTDVQRRLKELGIQLPTPSAGLEQPAPTPPAGGAPGAASPPMMEAILDESGETLGHILSRFKNEVKRFEAGEDLDNDLYYALFDYYSDAGEMPYGVAKARDGDPYEWITDRLDQELGTGNYAPRLPEADNMATFVEGNGCNMTMEGEYCPEHGLMECGMMEMGTVAGGVATVMGEQGTAEGMLGNPGQQDSPAAQAITRRILMQRTDLLAKYGPEKVMSAIDEVADFVGNVDEIGSSDVSGWVRHVEQMLGNMKQGMAEGSGANKTHLAMAYLQAVVMAPLGTPEKRRILNWQQRLSNQFDIEIDTVTLAQMLPQLDSQLKSGQLDRLRNRMASRGELEIGETRQGMEEANDDPINYNAAITGSYYEAKEDPLVRMKSLALRK